MNQSEAKPVRLHALRVENTKGIKLVAVEFDALGNWIPITGPNGAGKSSFMDAVAYGLAGSKWKPDQAIRIGTDRSEVEVQLDNGLTIKRITTPKSMRLEIISSDGSPYRGEPQKLLDSIIGKISFDPFEFARWSDSADGRKKQVEALLAAVGKAEEARTLDSNIKDAYDLRRVANAEMERAQSAVRSLPMAAPGTPSKEVDVSALSAELEALSAAGRENGKLADQADANAKEVNAIVDRANEIGAQIGFLKGQLSELNVKMIALEAEGNRLFGLLCDSAAEDTSARQEEIRRQIQTASTVNAAVRNARDRKVKQDECDAAIKKAKILDDSLTGMRDGKASLLRDCALPVDGLEIGDDGLSVNGVSISQVATSMQIRLSTMLCHAMSPSFPVIFIRDASLLDRASREWFQAFAEEHDLQMLVELVGEQGDGVGIFIEAGEMV